MIDRSEFKDWEKHPVTKELMVIIDELVKSIDEALLNEDLIINERLQHIKMLGRKQGLQIIRNATLEDFVDEDHTE